MGNYSRQGYHESRNARWRNNFNKQGAYVGVELELEVTGGYNRLLSLLPNFRNNRAPLMEVDGSLTDAGGIELVFPPIQLRNLLRKGSVFTQCLDKAEEVGVRTGRNVGMHLNVNTSGWSFLKETMFVLVVHHMPQQLLERLGGRRLTSYCEQYTLCSQHYDEDDLDGVREEMTDMHSYAAEFKNHRIELRFPNSTTDKVRIKHLMSFIQHLSSFAGTINTQSEYDMDEIVKSFFTHLEKSKTGKALLAYMRGAKSTNDSTNSIASPAAPVGRVSATAPLTTAGIITTEQMLHLTATVSSSSQLGQLYFSGDYIIAEDSELTY